MRSAAHIAVLNRLALAAAGGCYVGAPPRPAARSMKFLSLLCPVTPNIAGTACIKACLSLFPRRVSAPLHPLDGRKTAIPPAQQTECDAAQMRNAVCQPDTHSEAAGVSRANDQAEVCGHVCLTE